MNEQAPNALLAKYMAHVLECEGITFVEWDARPTSFTDAEWAELRAIAASVVDPA